MLSIKHKPKTLRKLRFFSFLINLFSGTLRYNLTKNGNYSTLQKSLYFGRKVGCSQSDLQKYLQTKEINYVKEKPVCIILMRFKVKHLV